VPRPPVLLIPGLMAGDWAMRPLSQRLHSRGYVTYCAGIGLNVGCTSEMVDRLEQRLETIARQHESQVALVGHSRGGTLAKLLTLRRPELVAGLITLASPNVNPLAVSRMVDWQLRLLNRLRAAGLRRFLGADCLSGECADTVRQELERPFPSQVPYTMLYSRNDGVVDWQACCDPDAELVEMRGTHMQLAMRPVVLDRVADILDRISMRGEPQRREAV
jgi:pimeloyl-ACP methyl ester carboxylesterase